MYLAAPLFTAAERAFNLALARGIEDLGWRVFLPQRDIPPPRAGGRTRRLFDGCRRGIRASNVVVAVCDGAMVDDGTAWECGYAVGIGKPVYVLRTDVRRVAADEHVNLMLQESAAGCFTTAPRLLRALRRHLTRR